MDGFFSGGPAEPARRRPHRLAAEVEHLERRELLATVQDFTAGGTAYTLQQVGGPPAAQVVGGGPTGNYLQLTTRGGRR